MKSDRLDLLDLWWRTCSSQFMFFSNSFCSICLFARSALSQYAALASPCLTREEGCMSEIRPPFPCAIHQSKTPMARSSRLGMYVCIFSSTSDWSQ